MPSHECSKCEWTSGYQPNSAISGSLASWHVYEKHQDVWLETIGSRPPVNPDPRDPETFVLMELLGWTFVLMELLG